MPRGTRRPPAANTARCSRADIPMPLPPIRTKHPPCIRTCVHMRPHACVRACVQYVRCVPSICRVRVCACKSCSALYTCAYACVRASCVRASCMRLHVLHARCVCMVCVCIRACAHVVLGCHACLAQRRFEYSGTRYHFHNILEFIFATLFLVHSPATLCGLFPQHSLVYFRATFFNLFLCNILSFISTFQSLPTSLAVACVFEYRSTIPLYEHPQPQIIFVERRRRSVQCLPCFGSGLCALAGAHAEVRGARQRR